MRFFAIVSVVLLLVSGLAFAAFHSSPEPKSAVPEAVVLDEPASLLRSVADAYKRTPVFVDQVSVDISQAGTSGTDAISIRLGAGTDAEITMQGFVFTAAGDNVYIQQTQLPSKYVMLPLEQNLLKTLDSITGGRLPAPQAVMRYSDDENAQTQSLGMGIVRNLKLDSSHQSSDADGRPIDILKLSGDQGGTSLVSIDRDSRFIRQVLVSASGASFTFKMSPKPMLELRPEIAVDVVGKKEVDSMAELRLAEGDPAPEFELPTSTGETIALADLRGSVVVLDFWATWCGPCKLGLPGLAKLQNWANEENHAIRVLGINMGENDPTPAKTLEKVDAFWSRQNFPMPTLMDYDAAVARQYEVSPIPHTVVVGPDGTILKIKVGFDRNAEQNLRSIALKALGQTAG